MNLGTVGSSRFVEWLGNLDPVDANPEELSNHLVPLCIQNLLQTTPRHAERLIGIEIQDTFTSLVWLHSLLSSLMRL